MRHRLTPVVILLAASLVVSAEAPKATLSSPAADPNRLVVHEWGTFTSVAGLDGSAVEWTPLVSSADLPCFVDKVSLGPKTSLPGTVRMETPVLYFYSAQDTVVDVRVRFKQGVITEWYPKADVSPMKVDPNIIRNPDLVGRIEWGGVKVLPKAAETYPVEPGENHYYAARATDAAPLQVGGQREKLLFYRGVGMFAPPLNASLADDGEVTIRAASGKVGDVVLFENRNGVVSYQFLRVDAPNVKLAFPSSRNGLDGVRAGLVRLLVSHGLYAREAKAMVETWRDSWFEEGTRVFYIVPRATVDEILPLEISPAPAAIERVFVGRVEILRQEAVEEVAQAILKRERGPIARRGRFVNPILERLRLGDRASHDWLLSQLGWVYEAANPVRRSCG